MLSGLKTDTALMVVLSGGSATVIVMCVNMCGRVQKSHTASSLSVLHTIGLHVHLVSDVPLLEPAQLMATTETV